MGRLTGRRCPTPTRRPVSDYFVRLTAIDESPTVQPSTQDIQLLSEHLFYEVQMTFSLARFLAEKQGTMTNQILRNAQIEAFTIHGR